MDLGRLSIAFHKSPAATMLLTVTVLVGLVTSSDVGAAPIAVATTLPGAGSSGET